MGSLFAFALTTAGVLAVSGSESIPQTPTAEPDSTRVAVFARAELEAQRAESGRPYLPFLSVPTLRAGLYELGVGTEDGQQHHDKAELYYVLSGTGTLFADGERRPVGEGDVIFIAAHVEHRFEDITDDLSLLVFFSEADPE